jgi:hypothetical protein
MFLHAVARVGKGGHRTEQVRRDLVTTACVRDAPIV